MNKAHEETKWEEGFSFMVKKKYEGHKSPISEKTDN